MSTLPIELRRTSVPSEVRAWVRREVGSAVVGVARLPGASSAAVHRLDLADGSRIVLRRYVWPGFIEAEPEAPGREVDALRIAHRHGLAVPAVLAADPDGRDVGDGVPALLMGFLRGQPVAVPEPHQLASVAAAVHAVDATQLGHEYFRWYDTEVVRPPSRSSVPALWDRAIGLWRDAMPVYRPTFIHRDFHPGNVMWSRGRLSGVVDWANACRGPLGCDLAHCRANLRDLSGPEAGDAFVAAYEALAGEPLDPYWILAGILEHDLEEMTEARLALVEPDLAGAVAAISA